MIAPINIFADIREEQYLLRVLDPYLAKRLRDVLRNRVDIRPGDKDIELRVDGTVIYVQRLFCVTMRRAKITF